MNDLLQLKSALVGGDALVLTKKEISDLRQFLLIIKTEMKLLLPFAKIFQFKKTEIPLSKNTLIDGFHQFNKSLKNLFKASQIYKSNYQYEDLEKLIVNFKLVDETQQELLDLAHKLKDLLVGQNEIRGEQDYLLVIDNLTESLRLYSFFIQGYIHFEISKPEYLVDAIDFVQDWFQLLENSVQFKKTKLIDVNTIDPLIQKINEISKKETNIKLMPIDVSTETLLSFYKTLFVRVFQAGAGADLNHFVGFTKSDFIGVKREIGIFRMYLNFLNSNVHPELLPNGDIAGRLKIVDIQVKLKNFKAEEQSFLNSYDTELKKTVIAGFNELKDEFLLRNPVVYRYKKMVISSNQDLWDQNWEDLARAVYVKMLSRELLIGWGSGFTNKLIAKSSISESQLVNWYSEFKQFGIEIKTFDPRSSNAGSASFKQANLLSKYADGDDKMNFNETIYYLNVLLSGGGQTLNEMQGRAKKINCLLEEEDVFKNKFIDEKCFINELKLNFVFYFNNLPQLKQYVSKLNTEQFNRFYYELMDIARIDSKQKGIKLETADVRTMSILLHFIETLYARFDVNRDSELSAAEIRGSYPVFQTFAVQYAKKNSQAELDEFNGTLAQTIGGYGCYTEADLIREAFIFMVYNGRAPKSSDLTNVPCLLGSSLIKFKGTVDRRLILNTFKILKAELGN